MSAKHDLEMERFKIEHQENWRGMLDKIPALKFDFDCEVVPVPPFSGAIARLWIRSNGENVSLYLDWFGRLGYSQEPYWEIYPDADGDNSRFALNETVELMAAIKNALKVQP